MFQTEFVVNLFTILVVAIRPRQVVSRFLVTARTKYVKSEVWPLFVLRMRSQFLRPFSRIINKNLRIHTCVFEAALDTVCRAGETDTEQVLMPLLIIPMA